MTEPPTKTLQGGNAGRDTSRPPPAPRSPETIWPDRVTHWRRATAVARIRPSFLIIGAQKSGTSALFRYLRKHPLFLPPLRKEIHYFDYFYDRGASWYRAHFPTRRRGPYVTGEASPFYLMHPLAPQRVAAFAPDMKLIAILRDPVQRALSHHAMSQRGGALSRCRLTLRSPPKATGCRATSGPFGQGRYITTLAWRPTPT